MKNRDPLCEAAEGVAETQQCLGATQQVGGSPKGEKIGWTGSRIEITGPYSVR